MVKKITSILENVLEEIKIPEDKLEFIEKSLKEFISNLKESLKKQKVDAEVFIGGSFAKKTVIKKDKYDVDLFLRFSKNECKKNISDTTEKLIKKFKNYSRIHGSRDYFRIRFDTDFFIELVPVKKIKNSKEFENITDLSYSHVKYINKKIKSQKILNDIKISKSFCHANNCYGAESYIKGFSGYALELLVYHYGGFVNMLKKISNAKKREKIVVDIEKDYRNKKSILMDMNSAKLGSPIILVDPTFSRRNALAALSEETFERFKKISSKFLKNPSKKYFEKKSIDFQKIKEKSIKNKNDFVIFEAITKKQEGDIAGSKLKKFYGHLNSEAEKFYKIVNKGFEYSGKKNSKFFFSGNSKKDLILEGPSEGDKKNASRFKKKHKGSFVKKGKLYVRISIKSSLKDFFRKWKIKNKKKLKEMSIKKFNVL